MRVRCGTTAGPSSRMYSRTATLRNRVQDDIDDATPFVNVLEDDSLPIRIAKVTPTKIYLRSGLVLPSTCIFINGKAFVWTPPRIDPQAAMPNGGGWEAWSNDIWTLLEITAPRPEILVLGTGDTVLPIPQRIRAYLHSLGIQLDVQNTRNACSTFDLLSEEGRTVAAALLPIS
ncbi:hypothetical protein MSPP1_000503 [Malassezia sp. CBS 17886]|nr:hypothetical protein MSPP1_000503 [Malassezia sp. CBS 17886]